MRQQRKAIAFVVALDALILVVQAPVAASAPVAAIDPLQTATRTTIAASQSSGTAGVTLKFAPPAVAPIPYVPFPVTDPISHATVSSSTLITTPTGQSNVPAGAYWAQVNSVEAFFNARGRSLRTLTKAATTPLDLGHIAGGTQADLDAGGGSAPDAGGSPLTASGGHIDAATLGALEPKHVVEPALGDGGAMQTTPPPVISIQPGKPVVRPSFVKATPSPSPTPNMDPAQHKYGYKDLKGPHYGQTVPNSTDDISYSKDLDYSPKPYKLELGGSEGNVSVSASFSGKEEHNGTLSLAGDLKATAELFQQGGDVAKISIKADADSYKFSITAVGQSIANYSGPLPANGGPSFALNMGNWNDTFDGANSSGSFPMSVSQNISGVLGVNYSVVDGARFQFQLVPNVELAATFAAQLTLLSFANDYINEQGAITGSLTVMQVAMPIALDAGFKVLPFTSGSDSKSVHAIFACRPQFTYGIKGSLQYVFLQGSINGTISGCVVFCQTEASFGIINWNGYKKTITMFDDSDSIDVGDVYQDLESYGFDTADAKYVSDAKHYTGATTHYSKDDSSGMPEACDKLYQKLDLTPSL